MMWVVVAHHITLHHQRIRKSVLKSIKCMSCSLNTSKASFKTGSFCDCVAQTAFSIDVRTVSSLLLRSMKYAMDSSLRGLGLVGASGCGVITSSGFDDDDVLECLLFLVSCVTSSMIVCGRLWRFESLDSNSIAFLVRLKNRN
eukprot:192071_1